MIPARQASSSQRQASRASWAALVHFRTRSENGTIAGLVKTASAELGRHGVRVNCISSSVVPTPLVFQFFQEGLPGITVPEIKDIMRNMSDLKGVLLLPEDVANATLFLASDAARFISGHNLHVDGGFTASKAMNL